MSSSEDETGVKLIIIILRASFTKSGARFNLSSLGF